MITLSRTSGEWCIGRQEGQHAQGIKTSGAPLRHQFVSGCKPPELEAIERLRSWSMAGYVTETQLRRLLTVRSDWSRK